MVVPRSDGLELTLGAITARVATRKGGVPVWSETKEPAGPDDLVPFALTVPVGYLGMGRSLDGVRGQIDYGSDYDAHSWDRIAVGPAHDRLGLSLPAPVTKIVTAQASAPATSTHDTPTGSDGGGPNAWTNPTNIAASDNSRAAVTLATAAVSNRLRAQAWGASPSVAPSGVAVNAECRYTGGGAGAQPSLRAQLLDASGTPVGSTRTLPVPSSESVVTFGSADDRWDTALALADYADADFGVSLEAVAPDPIPGADGSDVRSTNATQTNEAGSDVTWTNPGNAAALDGSSASVTTTAGTSGSGGNATAAAAQNVTIAGNNWFNPDAARTQNNQFATVEVPAFATSDWLQLTGYGLSLPAGALIKGIQIAVTGFSAGQMRARLVKGGAIVGAEKVVPTGTAGGANDLWGTTWTEAEIEAAGFGVALRIINSTEGVLGGSVDAVTITVFYQVGATQSRWLLLTDWSAVLPAGATVNGITVAPTRAVPAGYRLEAQLVKAGVRTGTVKDVTSTGGGGAADLWGDTWSEAQVEAAGFGIAFRVVPTTGLALPVTLDGAALTVHYTEAATSPSWTVEVDHVTLTLSTPSRARFVYVAAGNVLTKLALGLDGDGVPAVTVHETKPFTHGDTSAAPPISDVIVAKDGGAPGDARLLVGFEDAAQIQQVNTIAASGADTYGSLGTPAAYAGVFGRALAGDNTETRIYKSTGIANQNDGPFAKLQNASLSESAKDFTDADNWEPPVPNTAGGQTGRINAIGEFQKGAVVATPSGIYAFNEQGNGYLFFAMTAYESPENGRGLLPWGRTLLATSRMDLVDTTAPRSPMVGLTALLSNLSPVQGFPTALASDGFFLYAPYWTGVDTWILRVRAKRFEAVPHEYVIEPWHHVPGVRVDAITVVTDAAGVRYLLYGDAGVMAGSYDLRAVILDPASARRWAESGFVQLGRQGDAAKATLIERVAGYASDVDDEHSVTATLAFDDGAFLPIGFSATWSEPGRAVFSPTPGVNDRGFQWHLRLDFTNPNGARRPALHGLSRAEVEHGGLIVEGQIQADRVRRWETELVAASYEETEHGGTVAETAAELAAALEELSGDTTTLIYEDFYGDRVPRDVWIDAVSVVTAVKEGPERDVEVRVKVRGRELLKDAT